MRLTVCDICGNEILTDVHYMELYRETGSVLDGDKLKPIMPTQELCGICADNLRTYISGMVAK